MRFSTFLSKPFAIGSVLLGTAVSSVIGSVGSLSASAIAQSQPACQPPRANQFLLLVVNSQSNAQTQLQQLLPSNAILTACDYMSRNVIRVEGFSSAEIANAWAKYVSDRTGLQAFIARPATAAAPSPAATPAASGTARTPAASSSANSAATPATTSAVAYNPQPLGAGYAVLVNYADRPEVAIELSQAIAHSIGLAVYNQRPYLLAIQTADQAAATALLKTLSDRGFTAQMVDSQRVVLLTPAVAGATRR